MAKQKVKPTWMIISLFIGGIVFLSSFIDALSAPSDTTFSYVGIDMNKTVYIILTFLAAACLFYISSQWYKQKKSGQNP